jgi:hypothetical protein
MLTLSAGEPERDGFELLARDDGIMIRDGSIRPFGGQGGGCWVMNGRKERAEYGELQATPPAMGTKLRA